MTTSLYTSEEERLNYSSHVLATILSIIGWVYLYNKAQLKNDNLLYLSLAVYGGCVTFGFIASSIYHYVEESTFKNRLRLMDHMGVYLFILGTYTPFALAALPLQTGITVLIIVWSFALIAMFFKYTLWKKGLMQKYAKLDTVIYTILGALALFWLPTFIEYLSLSCVLWVSVGGIVYLIGAGFYLWKSCPYNHLVWHIFVVLAATIHYYSILTYVVL